MIYTPLPLWSLIQYTRTLDMGHGGTGTLSQPDRQLLPRRRLLRPGLRRHRVVDVQEAGQLVRHLHDTGRASQVQRLAVRRHWQQDRSRQQTGFALS